MYNPDLTDPLPDGAMEDPSIGAHLVEDEDYKSDKYYDEQGQKVQEFNYDHGDGINSASGSIPPNDLGYTLADMNPTIRDPRCNSSTHLAYFWPVYVGNFRCSDVTQQDNHIRKFFASRGLHVRWWFYRSDDYYLNFQMEAGLYDMLVYFVSERDSKFAIERCHRDTYQGYRLNVFPGREPVYFEPNRSVYVEKMNNKQVVSEQFLEKHVQPYGTVSCVVKFSISSGAVEFKAQGDALKAQKNVKFWKFMLANGKQMQKQRFLEQDLIGTIETYLSENPDVLKPKENDLYMAMLLQGKRPFVDSHQQCYAQPVKRKFRQSKWSRITEKQQAKKMKNIMKTLAKGEYPRCYSKNKSSKQRFHKMVEKAQEQMNI